MALSLYEAAIINAAQRAKEDFPKGTYLVLDTDKLQIGICELAGETEVKFIASTKTVQNAGSLVGKIVGTDKRNVLQQWKQALPNINSMLAQYLRLKEDDTAFSCSDESISWTCSELTDKFEPAGKVLDAACEEAAFLLEARKIDEDDVRFLIAGSNADFYLFDYRLRIFFTSSAFMQDDRFCSTKIVGLEQELCASAQVIVENANKVDHDIAIEYVEMDDAGRPSKGHFVLAEKNQPMNTVQQNSSSIEYAETIYVDGKSQLTVSVDGELQMLQIPFRMESEEGEAIDIALVNKQDELILRIRRTAKPTAVYDLNLKI